MEVIFTESQTTGSLQFTNGADFASFFPDTSRKGSCAGDHLVSPWQWGHRTSARILRNLIELLGCLRTLQTNVDVLQLKILGIFRTEWCIPARFKDRILMFLRERHFSRSRKHVWFDCRLHARFLISERKKEFVFSFEKFSQFCCVCHICCSCLQFQLPWVELFALHCFNLFAEKWLVVSLSSLKCFVQYPMHAVATPLRKIRFVKNFSFYFSNGRLISAEKSLCRELMKNYTTVGRNGRPVVNMSKPLLVEFGLGLIQMDLDEKNKILSTSMWSRYVSVFAMGGVFNFWPKLDVGTNQMDGFQRSYSCTEETAVSAKLSNECGVTGKIAFADECHFLSPDLQKLPFCA